MGKDLKSIVQKFLKEGQVLTIATSSGKQPWIANAFYVSDDRFNLYFLSGKSTRHSKEAKANSKVAVAIYDHGSKPGDVKGIQIEGALSTAPPSVVLKIFPQYLKKFPETKAFLSNPKLLLKKSFEIKLYKIAPTRIFYLDEEKFGEERQELSL